MMHQMTPPLSHKGTVLHATTAFRTVLAHDADELARHLTGWEQSYDQLSTGHFRGALDELHLPHMQVFHENISHSVRQSCRIRPGELWFGFQNHPAYSRINGRPAGPEGVMIHSGNTEFELLTPAGHDIYGIVASRELLAKAALRSGYTIDWSELESAEVLQVGTLERAHCVHTLAALLSLQQQASGSIDWLLHGQSTVLAALLSMLAKSVPEPAVTASFQRRQAVVAKVRRHLLAHHDHTLSVEHLCEQVHVSRRTLQYCFEDVLGISPMQYLRRMRLNGVRRQLLDPVAPLQSIGELAAGWGFGSFSQFSSDYRKLFGASASASVKSMAGRG